MRNFLPFMEPMWRALAPWAYSLIRFSTGAIFVPHGVQKIMAGSYALGGLELAGGLLIAVGFAQRIAAVLLIVDVLWIISLNIGKGWLWTRGGVQYHVFLLGLLLSVVIGGAGLHAIMKQANERLIWAGYTLARIWMAFLILPSGWEKVFDNGVARIAAGNVLKTGFYPPMFWAWVVALLELVGMILLAVGLGTRLIALMMAIELGVIVVAIQMPNGYFWTSRGTEFALVLFLVCLAFVFGGGGRYSLDRKLGREF